MSKQQSLSSKSLTILGLIAKQYSFSRIVHSHPHIRYADIARAANEALSCCGHSRSEYDQRMVEIKAKHPQAYKPWTCREENELIKMVYDGEKIEAIALALGRQPGGIRSRLHAISMRNQSNPKSLNGLMNDVS